MKISNEYYRNNNGDNKPTPEPDRIVIPTTTPRDREELNEGIRKPIKPNSNG